MANPSNDHNPQILQHQNSTSSLASSGNVSNNSSTYPQSPTFTAVEDQPASMLTVVSPPPTLPWDPTPIVVDALKMHAELGDVQTSVSVLLALGDLRYICCINRAK